MGREPQAGEAAAVKPLVVCSWLMAARMRGNQMYERRVGSWGPFVVTVLEDMY